jgi:hypothetical protein
MKISYLVARSRRGRAARISASATLSSSRAYNCVVSVDAWPRRRRTASMETPALKLVESNVPTL